MELISIFWPTGPKLKKAINWDIIVFLGYSPRRLSLTHEKQIMTRNPVSFFCKISYLCISDQKCNSPLNLSFHVDLHFLSYRAWHTEISSFRSFFALYRHLKTQKIKILKNWKNYWRYHHFTHVYQYSQSYCVQFLRYGMRQT